MDYVTLEDVPYLVKYHVDREMQFEEPDEPEEKTPLDSVP
jgi:hypothetical protein